MEVFFSLPPLMIPFVLPLIAGLMAKSYGRRFWTWFLIGIPLPLIANFILLCLPDKTVNGQRPQKNDGLSPGSRARVDPNSGGDEHDHSMMAYTTK